MENVLIIIFKIFTIICQNYQCYIQVKIFVSRISILSHISFPMRKMSIAIIAAFIRGFIVYFQPRTVPHENHPITNWVVSLISFWMLRLFEMGRKEVAVRLFERQRGREERHAPQKLV